MTLTDEGRRVAERAGREAFCCVVCGIAFYGRETVDGTVYAYERGSAASASEGARPGLCAYCNALGAREAGR